MRRLIQLRLLYAPCFWLVILRWAVGIDATAEAVAVAEGAAAAVEEAEEPGAEVSPSGDRRAFLATNFFEF